MHVSELLSEFQQAGKRTHLTGTHEAGVVAALDMEGRLFTVWKGQVINRVNIDAIRFCSDHYTYHNPGGDVLWPAPEGTKLGYQYATGNWRVSPAIRFAHYQVVYSEAGSASIEAEIDLISNSGVGLPTVFRREISLKPADVLVVRVNESITYRGKNPLPASTALLAPWSLCQFDTDYGGKVLFPFSEEGSIRDLYPEGIVPQCIQRGQFMEIPADGKKRFQVALNKSVPWISFHHVQQGLAVKRTAKIIPAFQQYIDISDSDPEVMPDPRGVRFSVYNDSSNFMEIEAVGGCPDIIQPGAVLSLEVETTYSFL